MEPTAVTATVLAMASVLLGLNLFFITNLIKKFESASNLSVTNDVRLDLVEKQIIEIHAMREDLAVLKYAILGYLKKADKKDEITL